MSVENYAVWRPVQAFKDCISQILLLVYAWLPRSLSSETSAKKRQPQQLFWRVSTLDYCWSDSTNTKVSLSRIATLNVELKNMHRRHHNYWIFAHTMATGLKNDILHDFCTLVTRLQLLISGQRREGRYWSIGWVPIRYFKCASSSDRSQVQRSALAAVAGALRKGY